MPGKRFELGGYWLGQEAGSPRWYAYWYEGSGRVRRRSLRTEDLNEAKIRLAAFRLEHAKPRNARTDEVRLVQVLVPYLEDRADRLPSAEQARISARQIRDFFGAASFISDLTPQRQRDFIAHQARERGHAPSTISRTMSVLSAALGRARKEGMLTAVPQVIMAQSEIAEMVDAPAKMQERRLTLDELAAFFDAIPAKRSEHVFRFALVACNTLARPDAITDLSPWSVDWDLGLLRLNPPGRRQTKKHRPTVPLTDCLAGWLREWKPEAGRYVFYGGGRSKARPMANPKKAIRATAIRAGLLGEDEWGDDRTVTPYTFRRTMARLLRARGVPMADTAGMLGHKLRGLATTEEYADVDPLYLQEPREAIDGIMADLAARVRGPRRIYSQLTPKSANSQGADILEMKRGS